MQDICVWAGVFFCWGDFTSAGLRAVTSTFIMKTMSPNFLKYDNDKYKDLTYREQK